MPIWVYFTFSASSGLNVSVRLLRPRRPLPRIVRVRWWFKGKRDELHLIEFTCSWSRGLNKARSSAAFGELNTSDFYGHHLCNSTPCGAAIMAQVPAEYLASITENASRLGTRIQESFSERTRDISFAAAGSVYMDAGDDKLKDIKKKLDSNSDREKLDAMKRLIAVRSVTVTY